MGLYGVARQQEVGYRVDLFIQPPLPHDEALAIQQTELGVTFGLGDREVCSGQLLDKPTGEPSHDNFAGAQLVREALARSRPVVEREGVTMHLILEDYIAETASLLFSKTVNLIQAVRFVVDRHNRRHLRFEAFANL